MTPELLKRKGSLTQSSDGSFVLVDEEKKGYKVDSIIAVVWLKSDGKTMEQLTDDISESAKDLDRNVVKDAVQTIVSDLIKLNLVA